MRRKMSDCAANVYWLSSPIERGRRKARPGPWDVLTHLFRPPPSRARNIKPVMDPTSAEASGRTAPHVVIVGAGFGGLNAAKRLATAAVRITVVDRTNHHLFQPLLYEVAMSGLSPADIAQPIRSILSKQANCLVLLDEAVRIDLSARRVVLMKAELEYDFLVLASGAQTSYFGHDNWSAIAPGLKNIHDASQIRDRVLMAFETAEREDESVFGGHLTTFVVIGGGPSGVELAGALTELSRFVLKRDFRRIDPASARVHLIEAGPSILASFPADLQRRGVEQLEEMGVEVRVGARVVGIDDTAVTLEGGERIPCSVVIWAAGVRATSLTATLDVPLDQSGRVVVEHDCSIPGYPEAYCIGDAACFLHQTGKPLPGTSPAAMQMAGFVAESIRSRTGEPPGSAATRKAPKPFRYVDKGSMATIGRSRAIVQTGPLRFSGFTAWMAWLLVHVWFLIGFRNRMVVMATWFWSYVTYGRGARLITTVAAERRPVVLDGVAPMLADRQNRRNLSSPVFGRASDG